ncbi:hypothetical protein [Paracoccus aminovorans]|uniref:hypothetical protein n=1 Tax=Paracoccus aminovorans TaxID=34004 RepID=UPI00147D0205|nr:hypothetical protein [Paracoccus aminovorans]
MLRDIRGDFREGRSTRAAIKVCNSGSFSFFGAPEAVSTAMLCHENRRDRQAARG